MVERFFSKISNDVLQASEQIVNAWEEGISAVFHGAAKEQAVPAPVTTPPPDDDDLEEALRDNPLAGIADSVVGDILGGQAGPSTPWEHVQAFKSAITWSEPFIISICIFQLVMFVLSVYVSRKNANLSSRLAVMLLIAGIVKSSEYLNGIAAKNWQSFATQNYFDSRGVFMAVLVCAPLLLDSLIMLLFFLREASQLLVVVKTNQLKEKKKAQSSKRDKRVKKEQ